MKSSIKYFIRRHINMHHHSLLKQAKTLLYVGTIKILTSVLTRNFIKKKLGTNLLQNVMNLLLKHAFLPPIVILLVHNKSLTNQSLADLKNAFFLRQALTTPMGVMSANRNIMGNYTGCGYLSCFVLTLLLGYYIE